MQLYAITDRSLLTAIAADSASSAPQMDAATTFNQAEDQTTDSALATLARSWAEGGVAYIQIREKDLSSDRLATLSETVVSAVHFASTTFAPVTTRILVNGTPRVAAAAGAAGVHLPAGWTAEAIAAARNVFEQRGRQAIVSVACHSSAEAVRARDLGVDLALLSPVFEKRLRQNPGPQSEARPGMGLAALREACTLAAPLPIFALGGVTAANAQQCVTSGAAGVAAIRMFMGKAETWRTLTQAT